MDDLNSDRGSLLDYLRLMRVSNLFTAVADVMMGFLLVHGSFQPLPAFAWLVAASCLLYSAGMVLNDVFDYKIDRRQRPERPLVSGRISLATARKFGFGLLGSGVLCGWLAGYSPVVADGLPWRSGAIASALAASVLMYDAFLKRTPLGPVGMGLCRLLNVLLGMSLAMPFVAEWNIIGFGLRHLTVAGGIGIYIMGVTWFARTEAVASSRWQLVLATATMMAGIGLLGMLHHELTRRAGTRLLLPASYWWLLLAMLAFPILRRCLTAVADPAPRPVQFAVRHALWSLIMLDAAVVLLVRDTYALAVVALLIPTVILGKWIAST